MLLLQIRRNVLVHSTGNTVDINIHTRNESLLCISEELPADDLHYMLPAIDAVLMSTL